MNDDNRADIAAPDGHLTIASHTKIPHRLLRLNTY